MKGIFISYRREDSAPYAGRICDYVRRIFPSVSVFMDVEAINPGADFVRDIDANISDSAVVLIVIGPQWESVRDSKGQRRIDNPDDYVTREIATAIQRQASAIPVLVGGAKMPSPAGLSPQLVELSRRNAIEVSDARFAEDAERLCKAISVALGIPVDDQESHRRIKYGRFFSEAELTKARSKFRRVVCGGLALLILTLLVGFTRMDVAAVGNPPKALEAVLPCDDPVFKAEDKAYSACRMINGSMSFFMEVLDKIVFPFVILAYGFIVFVHFKVLRGKNWARITYVIFASILPGPFYESVFSNPNSLQGARYVAHVSLFAATLIVYGWAIRMMFTDPIRRLFWRA